ncbi:complex III assembly factor LYRM7 isoform X2 [Tachypleus tridentatus]|uniref:complex III assembly factor LYRM7 isoform X2 n=1 Tax=Tachypleus tridentatus TaxID=6853 RepID=UPI003FD44A54
MASLRSEVLACFRALHRTRKSVFHGDSVAIEARQKIGEEFRKHASESDHDKIAEQLKIGWDCEMLLREKVVQLQLNKQGRYDVKLRQDIQLEKNTPYIERPEELSQSSINILQF